MLTKLAHVSYVLSTEEQAANLGADFEFLFSPLSEPTNWAIFMSGLAAIAGLVLIGNKLSVIKDRIRFFRGRARSYHEYIPLILRLSVGIALIGAASHQVFISPAVDTNSSIALVEMILGCLLILGLALTPTTLITLSLGVVGLILHPELVDNLEFISTTLAILLLAQAKPSLDDLLGLTMFSPPEKVRAWVPLVLRLGLGLGLIIMAIMDKLLNPHLFGEVVEQYALSTYLPLSTAMWVLSATIIEFLLGLALILGYHVRVVSVLTVATLGLSFFLFGEEVFAHVTIFGTLLVLIITGAGRLSIDSHFSKSHSQS